MRRLSPARRERTALTPEAAGFPGARDCPERGAPRTWVRRRRLSGEVRCPNPRPRVFQAPEIALKEEGSVLEVRDRRLKGKVGCLGPEVRPVTVPQIAPKEERCVLGYASDD